MHNYIVQWGVNDSHLDEYKHFDLYRDALNYYSKLSMCSSVLFKAIYKKDGEKLGWVMDYREYKQTNFLSAGNNSALIDRVRLGLAI